MIKRYTSFDLIYILLKITWENIFKFSRNYCERLALRFAALLMNSVTLAPKLNEITPCFSSLKALVMSYNQKHLKIAILSPSKEILFILVYVTHVHCTHIIEYISGVSRSGALESSLSNFHSTQQQQKKNSVFSQTLVFGTFH